MTPPDYNPQTPQTTQVIMADLVARFSELVRLHGAGHKKVNHQEDPVCTPLRRPIKEDFNFKDDEDPSVDYVDIIGTEEQLKTPPIKHWSVGCHRLTNVQHNKFEFRRTEIVLLS